jgi:PAS domain S-box-containing protein
MGRAQPTRRADTQVFRDAFKASPIGIVVENLEGQPLFVNPAFCSMLGFSEEELRGKHCVDFSPPEDAEKDWALFQQLRAGSIDHYQLEKRYFRRDGTLLWGRLSLSLLNGRRSPLVLAMVEDITDKRRAEEKVRESEQRFRLIADTAPVLIWMSGTDKLCTYFNKTWLHFTGRSLEEEQGNGWAEGIHGDDFERRLDTYMQSFDRREKFRTEYRLRRYDGEYRWLLDIGVPRLNQDQSFAGYIGIAVDVTERKMAEEALRASEERLRLAQQAACIGTFEWNIPTGVNSWTPELEAMYGLPPGGFGGTQTAFENLIHPDDRAEVIRLDDWALKTGQPTKGEWRVVWPDGSVHWIAGRWQVFMNESGEPARMIGVNIDVTERKRAEEALLGMNRKLIEAQEQERARIGRELHDDFTQRLALLALELEQLQDNPSKVRSRVQELRKRTTEISNDVQALSHQLHTSKLEYLGVVAGIKSWCKEFAQRQGVEIRFRSDVSKPLPLEIGLCLFRVVQEALHNALKHSGVKQIKVQLTEQSNEVHLIVSDSGRGFDVEAAMHDQGLGLTSMRERVRLVSGTIVIDSKPAGGTTIQVRVPLESDHDAQRAVV